MKIQPGQPPEPAKKAADTDAARPASKPSDDKPSRPFGAVLREKKGREERGPHPESGTPALWQPPPEWPPREPVVAPADAAAGAPAVRTIPPAIQALCTEIVDRVQAAGPSEMRIEFRSNVLDGLVVEARRDGQNFEVQLQTSTPAAAALLAGNSHLLAERLERLGLQARITVRRAGAAAPPAGEEHARDAGPETPDARTPGRRP